MCHTGNSARTDDCKLTIFKGNIVHRQMISSYTNLRKYTSRSDDRKRYRCHGIIRQGPTVESEQ